MEGESAGAEAQLLFSPLDGALPGHSDPRCLSLDKDRDVAPGFAHVRRSMPLRSGFILHRLLLPVK